MRPNIGKLSSPASSISSVIQSSHPHDRNLHDSSLFGDGSPSVQQQSNNSGNTSNDPRLQSLNNNIKISNDSHMLEKALTNDGNNKEPQDLTRMRSFERVSSFNSMAENGDGGVEHQEGLFLRVNAGGRERAFNTVQAQDNKTQYYIPVSHAPIKNEAESTATQLTSNGNQYTDNISPYSKSINCNQSSSVAHVTMSDGEKGDVKHWQQQNSSANYSNKQQTQQIYPWKQLVPLITSPQSSKVVIPKSEVEENKPPLNGELSVINGNCVQQSPSNASQALSDDYNREYYVDNNTSPDKTPNSDRKDAQSPAKDAFDAATADADDDVFLTDTEASSLGVDGQKRRNQSLGAMSKDEPKSPRKVGMVLFQ